MEREERKKIFLETVDIVNNGDYITDKGKLVKIPLSHKNGDLTLEDTTLYDNIANVYVKDMKKYDDFKVEVTNEDCLCASKRLLDDGLLPAVLNMASFYKPGGGVMNGSGAQEENLCRRTNLFKSLFRFDKSLAKAFSITPSNKHYPLNLNYGGVYSPSIAVFRDTEDNNYQLLNEPFLVDVISMPGIKNPEIVDGKLTERDRTILKNKVSTILRLGALWGNNALVLGALGCGAYRTPANEMAEIFKEVIFSEDYKGLFKQITFAILEDKNSKHEYNPDGNLIPFKKAFSQTKEE